MPGVNVDGKPTPLDASAAAYIGDGGLCADAQSLAKWVRLALASRDGPWSRLAQETVLADGTRLQATLDASGPSRTAVAVEQTRMTDPAAVAPAKDYWKERLEALKALLEG